MKKVIICLFIFVLIISTNVFGNEYVEQQYFTTYSMSLNNNEININGERYKTSNFCYENNSCVMIPLNTFFTYAGFETNLDVENEIFTVKIDDSDFYVDNKNNKIGYGKYKNRLIVPTVFTKNECYIAFNDVDDIMTFDKVNGIVFLSVGDNFSDVLENHFKNNQYKIILKMPVNSNDVKFGEKQIVWNTKIYNSNGNLMLPVRNLFKTIYPQSTVTWNDKYKSAEVVFDNTKIEFDYKHQKIYINSKEQNSSGSLELNDGSIYMPLNCLKDMLKLSEYDIYWDKNNNTIYLRV